MPEFMPTNANQQFPAKQPLGYTDIAGMLRDELLAAPWQPGARLPSHAQLQQRFSSTRVTIQRAMDLLVEQGFIETRWKSGSFCAQFPPHLYRYALVFPGHPEATITSAHWSRQFDADLLAAETLTKDGRWCIVPYFDMHHGPLGAGYQRLWKDVNDHLLAGIIFAYSPFDLSDTPLIREPQLPMVFPNKAFSGIHVVPQAMNQVTSVFEMAFTWLAQHAYHRIAVLCLPPQSPDFIAATAARYGLTIPPQWMHAVDPYRKSCEWIRNALRIIFATTPDSPPDALFIADDHLVPQALNALSEMHIDVPANLTVVGYWNYPLPLQCDFPITLLGRDALEWLQVSIQRIETYKADPSSRDDVVLPPHFRTG